MLGLVRCFSCTPDNSSQVFLLHTSCYFSEVFFFLFLSSSLSLVRDVSLTNLMLVLLSYFSYTPYASFSEVFLLYTSC